MRTTMLWLPRSALWRQMISLCLLMPFVLSCPSWAQSKSEYSKQAGLDAEGNVYVSSDEGKLIKMATLQHCGWVMVASDNQTVGCLVPRGFEPELISQSLQLEVFLRGGTKNTIAVGAPIRDWRFVEGGKQVSVYFGQANAPGTFALYESATGRLIDSLPESPNARLMPQWAKTRLELQDETVPMGPALTLERTLWVAKVLRQIESIEPGMRRKDLLKVFTGEGGLSTRFRRTYVHIECPYIKVDVRFKAAGNENDHLGENPEDVIEEISRPYLAFSVPD